MGAEGAGASANAGVPGAAAPPAGAPAADPVQAAADAAKAAANAPPPAGAAGETQPPATPPASSEPKESALVRNVRNRERALVDAKNDLRTREQQLSQTVEQRVERAVAERLAKFKDDPIVALRALGFDDQTIASRLLNQGKQTPEEIARKAAEDAANVRKEFEQRERRQAAQRASEDFAAEAGNSEKYPHLNDEWTRPEMIREAHGVVDALRAKGIDPNQYTLADIAKHLEKVAKSKAERREKLKAERAKKVTPQGETQAEGNGSPGQGGTPGKTATTTTLGKNLGGRESLNGKPGHLLSDAELAASVDAQVAPIRAALRSAS